MADIDINYDLFDGNLKYAIVCHSKFEVEHCAKALRKNFPKVFFTSPKRFSRYVMSFGLPAAISPNLHKPGYYVGYDRPEYYEKEGYIVIDFKYAIVKELRDSDIPIEELLGIGSINT